MIADATARPLAMSAAETPGHADLTEPASSAAPPAADAASRHWVIAALDRFESPLIRYAMRLLDGDLDRGRDVVQEAFLRLCTQPRSRVEPHLAQWLYRVCRNLALDARRRDKRLNPLREEHAATRAAADGSPAAGLEQADAAAAALRELDALPDNQQEVLRLKFGHGLSYREIATVTGLSVSNVGFLIHTGLKTIRRRLDA